ncbi:MnhB domain-containing protein [Pontibacter ruber]|uniref:MnhB domain-containing protein n=1 Tax=Pontibacter ruber TaxID=1343895 RepID=A0ABW5CS85_9BACT|nr:MnhB domain-containing protein [Pontibacter ruber]
MRTIILSIAIRLLIPLFLFFSLYILFRGHNHPGGGFIGGLIGSIGFIFHAMVHGPQHTVNTFFRINFYGYQHQPTQSRSIYLMRMMRVNRWRKRKRHYLERRNRNRGLLHIEPIDLIAAGLFVATTSGMLGLFLQEPFMTARWVSFYLPFLGRLGTPLLFDTGVYLLVMGIVLKITFVMAEE